MFKPSVLVDLNLGPGLISAIINDLVDQPGTLPLLQYTLTELFERRVGNALTLGAYQTSGGVRGALASRADELYKIGGVVAAWFVVRLIFEAAMIQFSIHDRLIEFADSEGVRTRPADVQSGRMR